jgi:hypothetical protein
MSNLSNSIRIPLLLNPFMDVSGGSVNYPTAKDNRFFNYLVIKNFYSYLFETLKYYNRKLSYLKGK